MCSSDLEREAIDRAIEHDGSDNTVATQTCDQCGCLPVPMRCLVDQALASLRAPAQADHVGLDPAFINEDKLVGIEPGLFCDPLLARLRDIVAVLFGRVEGLFFSVRPRPDRVSDNRVKLDETWWVSRNQACSSDNVVSALAWICSRIAG